ncbi:MAG: hypothetical protein LBS53_11215, partial [Synergistaceae bacterium]|nr:hypothetical protein [Synergistaceae bacterium]
MAEGAGFRATAQFKTGEDEDDAVSRRRMNKIRNKFTGREMKMELRKMRFALFAALLTAFVFASARVSEAKPDWVAVKYTGAYLQTQKGKKEDDKNYRRLVMKFDIINNSKNGDVITAIYDRNINWSGVFTINQMEWGKVYAGGVVEMDGWKSASWNVAYKMKGTEPYKGEWYPGQVYKYEHSVPLGALIKPYGGSWKKTNEATKRGFNFKFTKWSLDFQVKSH